MTGRLLTAREVAGRLGVSPETVLRWTRRGELPAYRLPGGPIRYQEAALEAWLDAHATAGDGAEKVSPVPDATRRPGVSSFASPVPPRHVAARTEEN